MSSLNKPPEPENPLAGDGGVHTAAAPPGDPYGALDDLMAVIESLCPTWPEREIFAGSGKMLL